MQRDGRRFTVDVAADGDSLVSHAGAALLAEAADRLGLTSELSRGLAAMRQRRGGHDPGRVVRDLAVMLADGGDCLADLRAVRDQEPLFGPVASDATAFRVIDAIAIDPALLEALRAARARARENVWNAGAAPGRIVIDIDATLITSHSEKHGAAGTFKGGFGFHPLLAYLDESREPLAGLLRPGNAGANTASDHIDVVDLVLEQLPRDVVERSQIVVRTDSAAATHELTDELRAARIGFLMGYDLTETVRRAILELPQAAWRPALRQDGEQRDGAWVAEISDRLELSGWPEATRMIVRRERPHPGAQLSFTDHDGHRFLATLTDLEGDAVELERLHRARANAEDRVRVAKQTGLANLPFRDFDRNQVWLELSLIAQDLIAWTQRLALNDELAVCEPKTLRYRLLHTAARLAFHARRATLRLARSWPWAHALAAAFARLAALPPPAR
ncbi:MAG TPA: IS1380 family transposase [Vicinamibacteria bacterium]|nr:IS1380 family transposase [Vicinamibacteria bacterium]